MCKSVSIDLIQHVQTIHFPSNYLTLFIFMNYYNYKLL